MCKILEQRLEQHSLVELQFALEGDGETEREP